MAPLWNWSRTSQSHVWTWSSKSQRNLCRSHFKAKQNLDWEIAIITQFILHEKICSQAAKSSFQNPPELATDDQILHSYKPLSPSRLVFCVNLHMLILMWNDKIRSLWKRLKWIDFEFAFLALEISKLRNVFQYLNNSKQFPPYFQLSENVISCW